MLRNRIEPEPGNVDQNVALRHDGKDVSIIALLFCKFHRYFLHPRDNGKPVKLIDLGSLRLNIVYTEDHVFPCHYYDPLRDLTIKSADAEVRVMNDTLNPSPEPDIHVIQSLKT